jgi:hypothetical protein
MVRISSGMPEGAVISSRGPPHGLLNIWPLKIPDGKISLRLAVGFLTSLIFRSAITLHYRTLLRRQMRAAPNKVVGAETKVTAPMFADGQDVFLLPRTSIAIPALLGIDTSNTPSHVPSCASLGTHTVVATTRWVFGVQYPS